MSWFQRTQAHQLGRVAATSFGHIFKDSEASRKAWLSRQRGAKKADLSTYYDLHDNPGLTEDSVLGKFSEKERQEIAGKLREAEKLPSSRSLHTGSNGQYTPERSALHAKIIADIFTDEAIAAATPAPGERPTFIVLGGRGGSGKSKFTDGTVREFDAKKVMVLDPDAIKASLRPPYEGWNAAQVHDESSDLFDAISDTAIEMGLNIVHDGTLRSDKYSDFVKKLPGHYRKEAHYMFVSREEAATRSTKRFLGKDGKRGRLVPVSVILGNKANERNFDKLTELVDHWSAYDNTGASPKLISRKE